MLSQNLNHARVQQIIITTLGVLTIAVFMTSCAPQKSCSAYQEIEVIE